MISVSPCFSAGCSRVTSILALPSNVQRIGTRWSGLASVTRRSTPEPSSLNV
jgi:hypothetical protein